MKAFVILVAVLATLTSGCVTGPTPKDLRQAEISHDLGVSNLRAGKLTDALKDFLEAVQLHPDFAQAHNGLGLVYQLMGDNHKALVQYQRALALKPDYSEVRNNMARIYIDQGNYRTAIPLLRKALEDVFLPERFLAESNLGWCLFQIGQEEDGFKHIRNALAQNENYCVGYEYLGLMHKARREYPQALRELRELVERCPKYSPGYSHLGKVLLMVGDLDGGCQALSTCRQHSRMTTAGNECDRLFRENCPQRSAPRPDAPDTQGGG